MEVINVRNVHQGLQVALDLLKHRGYDRDSRNGKVRLFPTPVTTVYREPRERVLFHHKRDANPFFHLFESLWMLSGRNDVEFVTKFVGTMKNYSDNGTTFHGAYGHRWKNHFMGFQAQENGNGQLRKIDQIAGAIKRLKENPDDRRCVVSMWDATVDFDREGKDFPCNLQIIFSINKENELDMTVTNRSNDLIWGCYGANAVHFSFLQEYVAAGIGVAVGRYYQISNNLHAYHETLEKVGDIGDASVSSFKNHKNNLYTIWGIEFVPLVQDFEQFNRDLTIFMLYIDSNKIYTDENEPTFTEPFFIDVVLPLLKAHSAFKQKNDPDRFFKAKSFLTKYNSIDWQLAAYEWLQRREMA